MTDPYRRAGLRGNPFLLDATPGVAPSLFVDTVVTPGLAAPLPGQRRFVQLIGDKGAGKTTHLLHWRRARPGAYVHLPDGPGRFRWLPVTPICYWDELSKSPRPILEAALRRASARGATVVAGTHDDCSEPARRLGMAVDTVTFGPLTADAVLRWANARIRAVRRADAPPPARPLSLSRELAEVIATRAGTSWRTAADELHVWAARAVATAAGLSAPVRVHSAPVPVWHRAERARGRSRRHVMDPGEVTASR